MIERFLLNNKDYKQKEEYHRTVDYCKDAEK